MSTDDDGGTAFYLPYSNNPSINIINRLNATRRRELLMTTDNHTPTALHISCSNKNSIDIIDRYVAIRDKELLTANDNMGNFLSSNFFSLLIDSPIKPAKYFSLMTSGITQYNVVMMGLSLV
jgi:hypothetical protein